MNNFFQEIFFCVTRSMTLVILVKLMEGTCCGFCDGLEQNRKLLPPEKKIWNTFFFSRDMTRLLKRELIVSSQNNQSWGLISVEVWLGGLPNKCDRVLFHRRKNRATMKTQKENEVTVLSLKKKKKSLVSSRQHS